MSKRTEKLTVLEVEVGKLVPYENNSKVHSLGQVQQVASSIREWGFTQPILVDEAGVILAGHGRLEAALQLGMKKVPVIVAKGWSEEQKRAYVIADNRIAENGVWDRELLEQELVAVMTGEGEEGLRELMGMTAGELDAIDELVKNAMADSGRENLEPGGGEEPGTDSGDALTGEGTVRKGPAGKGMTLTVGRWSVPCTEEEQGMLTQHFEHYCDERGIMAGFIGWLCSFGGK